RFVARLLQSQLKVSALFHLLAAAGLDCSEGRLNAERLQPGHDLITDRPVDAQGTDRAKAISPPPLPSKPSRRREASTLQRLPTSSAHSPRPSARVSCANAPDISAAPLSSSSTRSDICPSSRAAPICSSSSSMHATKKAP